MVAEAAGAAEKAGAVRAPPADSGDAERAELSRRWRFLLSRGGAAEAAAAAAAEEEAAPAPAFKLADGEASSPSPSAALAAAAALGRAWAALLEEEEDGADEEAAAAGTALLGSWGGLGAEGCLAGAAGTEARATTTECTSAARPPSRPVPPFVGAGLPRAGASSSPPRSFKSFVTAAAEAASEAASVFFVLELRLPFCKPGVSTGGDADAAAAAAAAAADTAAAAAAAADDDDDAAAVEAGWALKSSVRGRLAGSWGGKSAASSSMAAAASPWAAAASGRRAGAGVEAKMPFRAAAFCEDTEGALA